MYLLSHFYILGIYVKNDLSYAKELLSKALTLSSNHKIKKVINWIKNIEEINKQYKNIHQVLLSYPYLADNLCTKDELYPIIITHLKKYLETDSLAIILYCLLTNNKEEQITLLHNKSLESNGYAYYLLGHLAEDHKDKEKLYEKAISLKEEDALNSLIDIYYDQYSKNCLKINISDGDILMKIVLSILKIDLPYPNFFQKQKISKFALEVISEIISDEEKKDNLIIALDNLILNQQTKKDIYTILNTVHCNDIKYINYVIKEYEDKSNFEILEMLYKKLISMNNLDEFTFDRIINYLRNYNINISINNLKSLYIKVQIKNIKTSYKT